MLASAILGVSVASTILGPAVLVSAVSLGTLGFRVVVVVVLAVVVTGAVVLRRVGLGTLTGGGLGQKSVPFVALPDLGSMVKSSVSFPGASLVSGGVNVLAVSHR